MKKIGKKLCYLTKVFLVLGLIFSNLTGLTTVFAYTEPVPATLSINEDKIVLSYDQELGDTEQITVNVSENYTYLDESKETELTASYDITSEELLADGGYVITSQMIPNIVFDGTYEAEVMLYDKDTEELFATATISKDYSFESGMKFTVLDSLDNVLEPDEENKYVIGKENPTLKVVGVLLPGKLNPSDTFIYDEEEYIASEILKEEFTETLDFNDHLYGEHDMTVEFAMTKNEEEVSYDSEFTVAYGTYQMNTDYLNEVTTSLELDKNYVFVGEEAEGEVYVYLTSNNSLLDLYSIATGALNESKNVTFVLSDSENEDFVASYEPVDEMDTLEAYLSEFALNDTMVLTLIDGDLSVTYQVVIFGDVNGDNAVTRDDLLVLIDQVVGNKEVTDGADVYGTDEKVDMLDVVYLDRVINTNEYNHSINYSSSSLSSVTGLEVSSDTITSGDEFEVTYAFTSYSAAISSISGNIEYDSEKLELVSVSTNEKLIGSRNGGKFAYVSSSGTVGEKGTILTLKFRALKAGSSNVTINNVEYSRDLYYTPNGGNVTKEITVNESDDNELSSLTVGGQEITLEDGVLEYSIDVPNDVTSVDVSAIVSNLAAKVASIVAPKELAEGENIILVTVKAENGDELVYTIKVNRAAKPVEKATAVSYQNTTSSNDTVIEEPKKEDAVTKPTEPEPVKEKKSNLPKIIIVILILLVIAGLIYLIFRNEDDDEGKKANKEINKLKKEDSNFKETNQDKKVNKNDKKGR